MTAVTGLDAYLTSLPEPVLSTGETRLEVERHLPLVCACDEGHETYELEVLVEDSAVSTATWQGDVPWTLTEDEAGLAVRQVEECTDADEWYRDEDADELACERARDAWEARCGD